MNSVRMLMLQGEKGMPSKIQVIVNETCEIKQVRKMDGLTRGRGERRRAQWRATVQSRGQTARILADP